MDYRIKPPPEEKGSEKLYRVVYTIDVSGRNPRQAAVTAWQMMRYKDAYRPVLIVIDDKGKKVSLDLSQQQLSEHDSSVNTAVVDKLRDILDSLDSGGEQSRQFSCEIAALKELVDKLA